MSKSFNLKVDKSKTNKLSSKTINKLTYRLYSNDDKNIKEPKLTYLQRIEKSFIIDSKEVIISSNFDSGNLKNVNQSSYDKNHFFADISADCEELIFKGRYRSWFFFSVILNHQIRQNLTFTITNITSQSKYYYEGYKPVFFTVKDKEDHTKVPNGFLNENDFMWNRLKELLITSNEENTEITFKHKVTEEDYSIYFAFCFPYSYNKILAFSESFTNNVKSSQALYDTKQQDYKLNFGKSLNINTSWFKNQIYIHKELLTFSSQKRKIELITISSFDQITAQKEHLLKGLFPLNGINDTRCYSYSVDKPIIFISARVHPAETMSSYVLEGLMKFLVDNDDIRSKILRKYFVFKIIPVINPDGVSNGYYRFDTNCLNLNRHYINPDPNLSPEVYAIKRLFMFYSQQYRVKHFFDLHGHFSTKGHFVFLNNMDFISQIEALSIPFLLSSFNYDFNFKNCIYSEKSMKGKEVGDKFTKEGSSRVFFFRTTGLPTTYTIEASAFKRKEPRENLLSTNINYISSTDIRLNTEILQLSGFENDAEIRNFEQTFDLRGNFKYQESLLKDISSFFTIQCYLRLGCDILTSILEYEEINPFVFNNKFIPLEFTNYLSSEEEINMKRIRNSIASKLMKEDDKFRNNVLNKTYASNLEEIRKKITIYDKLKGKAKKPIKGISSVSQNKYISSNINNIQHYNDAYQKHISKITNEISENKSARNQTNFKTDINLQPIKINKILYSAKSRSEMPVLDEKIEIDAVRLLSNKNKLPKIN